MTDSQGNVISRRDFLPFGEHLDADVGGRSSVTAYQPTNDNLRQKFTTYQRDDESGLDFAEARMYENRHGRFTAVDPLLASGKSANPQTFNRYVYVQNGPVISTDPDGRCGGKSDPCPIHRGPVYTNGTNYDNDPHEGGVDGAFLRATLNSTQQMGILRDITADTTSPAAVGR